MTTTFRSDVADGILTVLNAYIAAHPSLLVAAYRARPASFGDLPCAFIENRPESVTHSQQVRTRLMRPSVLVVDRITDNAETMQRFDTLVDGLVEAFSSSPQFVTGSIWNELTVDDTRETIGEYEFAGVRFTFSDVSQDDGDPGGQP